MQVRVKLCGVTTPGAVACAVVSGVDAVGFVFAESPRRVDPARARELAALLPSSIVRVAVFRNPEPDDVLEVLSEFPADMVQSEPDPRVQSALGRRAMFLPVFHDEPGLVDRVRRYARQHGKRTKVLLEGPGRGGRGVRPDWRRAAALARRVPLVLAGGLRPDNVAAAIRQVRPVGVDVSSGVESGPGIKDARRLTLFVTETRRVGPGQEETGT